MAVSKYSFVKRNGLSIALVLLLVLALAGQLLSGWKVYNDEQRERGEEPLSLWAYFRSDHFMSSTFENWESEFLQMALYVLLTVKLYQVGSSESKDPDKHEEVDREPKPRADAPWPVRKGGLVLAIYKHSLSLAFLLLFILSFSLHLKGSYGVYAQEEHAEGRVPEPLGKYLFDHQFWFESFQNWQSEFLAVLSIVVLSIWLRQQGSPESKPVDAAHDETGK